MALSDMLKKLRKEKGLTQKELAEKAGLPLRSIINYENEIREPNAKALVALELVLICWDWNHPPTLRHTKLQML